MVTVTSVFSNKVLQRYMCQHKTGLHVPTQNWAKYEQNKKSIQKIFYKLSKKNKATDFLRYNTLFSIVCNINNDNRMIKNLIIQYTAVMFNIK